VATDGNLLPETVSVDGLVITPAQRSDLRIDFSTFEPGQRVQLLAADTFVESGSPSSLTLDAKTAATFVIEDSDPVPGNVPTALGRPPAFGPDDAVNRDAPKQGTLSTRRAAHWINDTQWEGRVAADVETVKANTVELWEIVNQSPMPIPCTSTAKLSGSCRERGTTTALLTRNFLVT
jgi:FtsP/CotA-like multicopper oxidase with cupredoxin domain